MTHLPRGLSIFPALSPVLMPSRVLRGQLLLCQILVGWVKGTGRKKLRPFPEGDVLLLSPRGRCTGD